jgi:hypothetical protein
MTVPSRNLPQAESGPHRNRGLTDLNGTAEQAAPGLQEAKQRQHLLQLMIGSWVARAIYVAAKLRIADHLNEGPASAEDLAAQAGVAAGPLYRILRALAAVGIFARQADGRFRLNPLAEPLRTDGPASLRAFALVVGEETDRCWCDVLETVRTGEPAFDRLYGRPFFGYLAEHPAQA